MAKMIPHQFLGQPRETRILGVLALESLGCHVRRLYTLKSTCCVGTQATLYGGPGEEEPRPLVNITAESPADSGNLPVM